MTDEEKFKLAEFLRTEGCGIHICKKCGKCKVCFSKCEKEVVEDKPKTPWNSK